MRAGSNLVRDPRPTLSISEPQKPSKIQETPQITNTVPSRVSLTIKRPVFTYTNCTSSLAGKKDHIYCSSVKIHNHYKHFTTSCLPLSDLLKRDERNSKEKKERHVWYQISWLYNKKHFKLTEIRNVHHPNVLNDTNVLKYFVLKLSWFIGKQSR